MLRNYLRVALRNLRRNSVYSFINIGGLAVGIASAILIFLWVWDEVTFDQFHDNAGRLGKLALHNFYSDKIVTTGAVPLPLYETLKSYDTRITNTCISHEGDRSVLSAGNHTIVGEGKPVSREFLTMFQFPLLKGSPRHALSAPASIVLTEHVAHALFGDTEPMGQVVRVANQMDFTVSAVLKDLPANSSFDFEYLVPWQAWASPQWIAEKSFWDDEAVQVFVELAPAANLTDVNAALTKLIRERRGNDNKSELFVHPLTDWHLRSDFKDGHPNGGRIDNVKSFSLIGLFILAIASINFMNLSTARSERRAREVGVRKCIGSGRKELIAQFLGEAITITALAFVLSLLLVQLALPVFNDLVQKQLSVNYSAPVSWCAAIVFILLLGTLTGSYPAFYLSSFQPVNVLKGNLHVGRGGAGPRKLLVTVQFFFSILLAVGTIVVLMQINYVKGRNVGYDRDNLLTVPVTEGMRESLPEIERELMSTGAVRSMTVSSSPVTAIYKHQILDWPGRLGETISFSKVMIGYHYASTMGIRVLQGRDFSEDVTSDSSAVLLNRTAVKVMGVKNPVGMQVQLVPWQKKWTVVGVLDDMIMDSPFARVEPGVFLCIPTWVEVVTLRLNPSDDMQKTLAGIGSVFKKWNPAYPFEYQFVDQEFGSKFAEINTVGAGVSALAFLALLITSLGIFGLAAFAAEQRTREIGIRKVMGASTMSILRLFTADFSRLVFWGIALAAPVAWWTLREYLNRYTYHIEFAWWVIPAVGAIALTLAGLIVGTQVIRVAAANPVESLRSE